MQRTKGNIAKLPPGLNRVAARRCGHSATFINVRTYVVSLSDEFAAHSSLSLKTDSARAGGKINTWRQRLAARAARTDSLRTGRDTGCFLPGCGGGAPHDVVVLPHKLHTYSRSEFFAGITMASAADSTARITVRTELAWFHKHRRWRRTRTGCWARGAAPAGHCR